MKKKLKREKKILRNLKSKKRFEERAQKETIKDEFIDCDPLTWYANAQPHYVNGEVVNDCPWNWDDHLKLICLQVDWVVSLAKIRRFWIMGASWWNGDQVDAIVILNKDLHKDRLKIDSKQYSIPIFTTIDVCVNYIRKQFGTKNVVSNIKYKATRLKF